MKEIIFYERATEDGDNNEYVLSFEEDENQRGVSIVLTHGEAESLKNKLKKLI